MQRQQQLTQQQLDQLAALINQNQPKEAIRQIERLTKQFPQALALYNLLAQAHYTAGNLSKAIGVLNKIAKAKPDYLPALSNLGLLNMEAGRLDAAVSSYKKVLTLNPGLADAHESLGIIRIMQGKSEMAEQHFNQALACDPNLATAHNNLANIHLNAGRSDAAIAACRRAIELDPNLAEAHNTLGAALTRLDRVEEALPAFDQAIALKPGLAEAWFNRGFACSHIGEIERARGDYFKAIELNPDYCDAHRELAQTHTYSEADDHYVQMSRLVKQSRLSPVQKMDLHFALGKADEDLGQFAAAFSHFDQCNRLRKKALGYSLQSERDQFAQIRAAYDAARNVETDAGETSLAKRMIFLVGMPRSATTLVEQILASHAAVTGGGEMEMVHDFAMVHDWSLGAPGSDSLQALQQGYRNGLTVRGIDADGPAMITDKNMLNFKWIGLILQAFPKARIVHVNRDPMATCWSIFKHNFAGSVHGYGCDQRDLGEYYNLYRELMRFWDERFPGRIYQLDYETLTEAQEDQTRKLLDHCALPWDENCLEFHRSKRAVNTASQVQVRQPLYTGSSEAWRRYEDQLKPLIDLIAR